MCFPAVQGLEKFILIKDLQFLSYVGYTIDQSYSECSRIDLESCSHSIRQCPHLNIIFLWLKGPNCSDILRVLPQKEVIALVPLIAFNASEGSACRGSVSIWMKSNLFHRFIEGQTNFSTSWHAKMVWHSMNWYNTFFIQTFTLPPSMHQKTTEHGRSCVKQPAPNQKLCWVRGYL